MTGEAYESQRTRALTRRSADLGLRRVAGRPVWGVVMEKGAQGGATTVIATDDGAATKLTSTGETIHLTKDDWPYSAATRLIGSAGDFFFECSPAWAYPLPGNSMVRFYLLTFDGVMTAEAAEGELMSGGHPLSDLYYAGDDVFFLLEFVNKNPDWRSHKPEIGLVEVLDEALPGDQEEIEVPGDEAPPSETLPPEGAGSDLLVRAAASNDVDEVAKLLAHGYDFGPNAKGITPLMAAAHAGSLEPLRLLLASGAPVDIPDSHGYTALMLACNAGHDVCVRLLLGAGADIQARDTEGFTSLMFAARKGHESIVRILMERGADPAATTERGLSAITLAEQKGHAQTLSILRDT